MLVLSRRIDEDLVIHAPGCAPVTVRVKRIAGNRVSIGIEAEPGVKIVRGEVPWRDESPVKGKT